MPAMVELPRLKESSVGLLTEPRSTSLASMPSQRIFAGFTSRWMMAGILKEGIEVQVVH